jgi:glutamine amidotransferase
MIAIIDYGVGNVGSLLNVFGRLGVAACVTASKKTIKQTNLIILPGVGAAGEGMRNLKAKGLDTVLKEEIDKGKLFLGICLGMQLLFEKSEEGDVNCLGILKGKVVKFQKEKKVPQIGWNEIKIKTQRSPARIALPEAATSLQAGTQSVAGGKLKNIFKNIKDKSYYYFVNSYYCEPKDESIIAAVSEYGELFPSIIVKENIIATQFHPEKSSTDGFLFLQNIIDVYKGII